MSGNKTNQPPPSQEKVRCFWCEHCGRKDNIKKHCDLKHPGKEYKWRHILAPGQSSLAKHFPGKVVLVDPVVSGSPKDILNVIDDYDEPSNKRFCSENKVNDKNRSSVFYFENNIEEPEPKISEESKDVLGGIVNDMRDIAGSLIALKDDFSSMLGSFGSKLVLHTEPPSLTSDQVPKVSSIFESSGCQGHI